MKLNPAFNDLTNASKDLADAQAQAAQEAADAAQKIQDDLIAGLQKAADSAFSAMQKAYGDLQKVQERFINLGKTLRGYLEELTGGKSAFTSPEQRYLAAKTEFDRLSVLASQGNEEALQGLVNAGKTFLDASRDYNASNEQFQRDFLAVTKAIEEGADYAQIQASVATNQLRVAENSYGALIAVNNATLSVKAAVDTLSTKMAEYAAAVAATKQASASAPAAPSYSGGAIVTPSGEVLYNPNAAVGSPTNPIVTPRPTYVRSFANGGMADSGFAFVGEQGPELVNFSAPAHVSTANATSNYFGSIRQAITAASSEQTEILKDQVNELQALVRLQAAANRELINQLSGIKSETAESTRLARIEASA
jgi:hypothetical protein